MNPTVLGTWMNWLLNRSLEAAALVLLVIVLQLLLHRKLSSRWRFALWWIVLARLLLPFGPPSALSVFNYFHPAVKLAGAAPLPAPHVEVVGGASTHPQRRTDNTSVAPERMEPPPPIENAAPTPRLALPPSPVSNTLSSSIPKPAHRLLWISGAGWLSGALVLTGCVVVQLIRFRRRFGTSASSCEPWIQQLLTSCCREFGVTRRIDLVETAAVQSPALFGVFKLRLLLPRGMNAKFSKDEWRYIFLHELAHIRRGDLWINCLVTALQIIHWFNPMLWFGFARMRADRELACDELALLHAGEKVGTSYGETVIKLLESLNRPAAIPGLVGILEDKKQMRRRISRIASFRKPGRWSALAVLLLAGIATAALTDPKISKPKRETLLAQNDSVASQRESNGLPKESPRPDLIGQVHAIDGAPIAATVFIDTAGPKVGTSTFCPSCYPDCRKSAKTDPHGNFKIESLDPQLTFKILAVAKGYQPKFVSHVDPASDRLEIQLDPADLSPTRLENSLRGRLLDDKGKPVFGAVINAHGIHTSDGGGRWGSLPGIDPLAVADENGAFVITAKEPFESMDVRVEARGFANRTFTELARGRSHDLVLSEGAAVTGRVQNGDKPLANVAVGLVSVDRGMENFTGNFDIATDSNGRFTFANLPPNTDYYVYGDMSSLKTAGAIGITKIRSGADGSSTDIGNLLVGPSHVLSGKVVLSDGQPIPPQTRLLIGRESAWDTLQVALGDDGTFRAEGIPSEPVSISVNVRGYHASSQNGSLDTLNPFRLVGRVDRDITNFVFLLEKGPDPKPVFISGIAEDEMPINRPLRGAESVSDHSQQWAIAGRVLDGATGKPLSRFLVTPGLPGQFGDAAPQWDPAHSVEGSNGIYTVYIGKRRTQPILKFEADGYVPAKLDLLPGNRSNPDVVLKKGSGPEGRVLSADGTPAVGASVALLCRGEQQINLNGQAKFQSWWNGQRDTTTTAGGQFTFPPELGMGAVAACTAEGFKIVTLEELATNSIIVLDPCGRVTGRLQRSSGPGTNEDLDLSFANSPAPGLSPVGLGQHAVTDSEGRFKFDRVPAGKLQVTYRTKVGNGAWMSNPLQQFTLKPGQSLELNITASDRQTQSMALNAQPQPEPKRIPGRQLKGIVLSPDGKPAQADVALRVDNQYLALGRAAFEGYSARQEGLLVSTGPDGRFELPLYESARSLMAVNEEGFAQIPTNAFTTNLQIRLQRWGQIEGTFRIGQRPGRGETLLIQTADSDGADQRLFFSFRDFQLRTDDQGRFMFAYVPPGEIELMRQIPLSANSRTTSFLANVVVKPGETAEVAVGGDQRRVLGKIVINEPGISLGGTVWSGELSPRSSQEGQRLNRTKTPAEREEIPKSMRRNSRRFHVSIAPDGTFDLDDVSPGQYEMILAKPFDEPPPGSATLPVVLRSDRLIVIPPAPEDHRDDPVELGTIGFTRHPISTNVPSQTQR